MRDREQSGVDYWELCERFFRPKRPRLVEALACVLGRAPRLARIEAELEALEDGVLAGRRAWESLAANGLIPMSWLSDPMRLFLRGRLSEHPPRSPLSAKMAVLMAADVQGVLTAEVLAPILGGECGACVLVYAYEAADPGDPWKKYDSCAPSWANDLNEMKPGLGYWLQVEQDCAWPIPSQ